MRRRGYTGYNNRNYVTMKTWLNDPERVKGCAACQVEYMRDLKQLDKELARIGLVTYYLVAKLRVTDARAMMTSASKQRGLIWSVIRDLRKYRVDDKYQRVFERDIAGIRRRVDWVYRICEIDLKETEHWPYFAEKGMDMLIEMNVPETFEQGEEHDEVIKEFLSDIQNWEDAHKPEIAAYMESIKPDLDRKAAFLERKAAAIKAEKEVEKAKKKAERDEIREIKANNEAYRKRIAKENKELDKTVKRVWGGWNE